MKTFDVDVKAFLRVQVQAETMEAAIDEARAFVECLDPEQPYVDGWNATRAKEGTRSGLIIETGSMDCEDEPYVEDADTGDVLQEF